MKKNCFLLLAATLICGTMTVLTSCSDYDEDLPVYVVDETKNNTKDNTKDNTKEETKPLNSVIERIKAYLAEADFQELAPLIQSLKDGTAQIFSNDLDITAIKEALTNLSALLESSKSFKIENLSKTLQYAVDASVAFEKTANNQYIGEREYTQSLIVKVNDALTYTITFSVEKEAEVALSEVGNAAKRKLTIDKNGTKVLTIINDRDTDRSVQDKKTNVDKHAIASIEYKDMIFSLDRTSTTNSIDSQLKYTKGGNEVFGISLKGESNLSLQDFLSNEAGFKGELVANIAGKTYGIKRDKEFDNQLSLTKDGEELTIFELLEALGININGLLTNLIG